MKWFKHQTDAHNNLKFQKIIDAFGMEGYGLYWLCVELVGREGTDYRINCKKEWILYLKKNSGIDEKKLKDILQLFGDCDLIDKLALKKSVLYLPKLQERADEYTDKLRRKSRQGTDNVPLEEKRRDKKRRDVSSSKKKFTYRGMPYRETSGKGFVIMPDGEWKEFAGNKKDLVEV